MRHTPLHTKCNSANLTLGSKTREPPHWRAVGWWECVHLRETEEPVVRPYWRVDDIDAAVAAAVQAGGEVAHPPLEIRGHGKFAIYL